MLNRKVSNYLFYFVLVVIAAVVFLVRTISIGNLDSKIAQLKIENASLDLQISNIEEVVEDNNDVQLDHLYQLYNEVPGELSITDLAYYTIAQLELVGITEASDNQRSVIVNTEITFAESTSLSDLRDKFTIVEVQVFFTTIDETLISDFINVLYNADQIFMVNHIEHASPDGENYIGVTINFLAFYEKIEDAS